MGMTIDWDQFGKQLSKYFLEGLCVALAALVIIPMHVPTEQLAMSVITLGLVAASTFAILDTYAPRVADGTRQGAGLGMGFKLAGVNL